MLGASERIALPALAVLALLAAGCGASGGPAQPPQSLHRVASSRPAPLPVPSAGLAPDPEEAQSFPQSAASVVHARASTPRQAARAAISPGAPSDAEVRAELQAMHAVLREQAAAARAAASAPAALPPSSGAGDSIGGNGALPVPSGVPAVVARVIAGANAIADFPYVYGGGHASFVDDAYDCSGSVSYALAAGGLLGTPLTSGELAGWGDPGPGRWITIYANAGHTYMYVNGVRFDTSGRSGPLASRWQTAARSNAGFVVRHPPGL